MCGIMGFNFEVNNAKEILNSTQYRGPNSSSIFRVGSFTLGHNRLSIIDHNPLSNQPFFSECGRYVIVFNGEVYNYQELRKKLEKKYHFKTNSDTEVILYHYLEFKEEGIKELRGMFAFAIYDKERDRLFCARDRLGIKPFIYYLKDNRFIFASEIKVILKALNKRADINLEAILQYLHYLYIPYPNTAFKDIFKLPPAHTLIYEKGRVTINRYWDIEESIGKNQDMKEQEALLALDNLLDESIKMRMIADVEIGSFLSGGIDSSLILYYMSKNSKKRVNTFTLGFEGAKRYDERKDAKIVANYFNTNHNEIIIKPDIAQLLPKMVKHFDEPFGNPTALLIYELTKETKKFATVALAGDGGDEIFGGYPRYRAIKLANRLKYIPKPLFKLISNFTNLLPESSTGNHHLRRIKIFLNSLSKPESRMYEDWVSYFSDSELNRLLKIEVNYKHIVRDYWDSLKYKDGILKSSIVDLKTFLPNNLLAYGDSMSMANSFEVRFPLIDHKVIEFMNSIDTKYRLKDGKTKYLIKQLLKDKIPNEIIDKPKLGLNPPMGIWLKGDLKEFMDIYLSAESIKKRGLFNYDYIQRVIYEHNSNKRDRSLYIWALIVLEEWFRDYID